MRSIYWCAQTRSAPYKDQKIYQGRPQSVAQYLCPPSPVPRHRSTSFHMHEGEGPHVGEFLDEFGGGFSGTVSRAGFDAHQGDLASLGLSYEGYREIGRMVRALGKPVFGVLEGGYVGEYVGRDLHELISGIEQKQ